MLQMKVDEFARDKDGQTRNVIMIVNEQIRNECQEARQMVWFRRHASVLTHSFDTPETASSSARLPRAFFSRMILALAVHLKGFGLALRWASQISMAASS